MARAYAQAQLDTLPCAPRAQVQQAAQLLYGGKGPAAEALRARVDEVVAVVLGRQDRLASLQVRGWGGGDKERHFC